MRFKAQIQNISTFSSEFHIAQPLYFAMLMVTEELVGSLASLGPVAWVRLNEGEVRFTIIPEQGTQVWA
jgi:HUS1 checkpoint protein